MPRVPREHVNAELAKADQRCEIPEPVWVWLTLDAAEAPGELLGWAENPTGDNDGRCGLVVAARRDEPNHWVQYLGWVRADHIRQRG